MMKQYRLIPGVRVDEETKEMVEGYYLERSIFEGDRVTSFFIEGDKECALNHIRKSNGIVDVKRLEKLLTLLEDVANKEIQDSQREPSLVREVIEGCDDIEPVIPEEDNE